jgi:hypothetical protein
MPSNYSGNPANVTTPLVRNVSGATSGSGGQVLIATSVAHLFATGDFVQVAGVTGTTEANGRWSIQLVDSTHFLLLGSSFVHTYLGAGTATDTSLLPYFQVPSDGDPATAESVLAAIQALADRTQFLAQQIVPAGGMYLVGLYQGQPIGTSDYANVTAYNSTYSSSGGGGPQLVTDPTNSYAPIVLQPYAGDVIEICAANTWVYTKTSVGNAYSRIECLQGYTGANGQVTTPIAISENQYYPGGATATPGSYVVQPMTGFVTITFAAPFTVYLNGKVTSSDSSADWAVTGNLGQPIDGSVLIKQWRPTP